MAIFPIFKISPYHTLFFLLQFNPFLIQGIAVPLSIHEVYAILVLR